jgi:hypothetical protein
LESFRAALGQPAHNEKSTRKPCISGGFLLGGTASRRFRHAETGKRRCIEIEKVDARVSAHWALSGINIAMKNRRTPTAAVSEHPTHEPHWRQCSAKALNRSFFCLFGSVSPSVHGSFNRVFTLEHLTITAGNHEFHQIVKERSTRCTAKPLRIFLRKSTHLCCDYF